MRILTATLAALALIFGLSACTDDKASAQNAERATRQSGYNKLTKAQPAHTMDYSPTRETINFWVDTWDEPGKLSYVYLQSATGDLLGYYILKGLPVSYCAALTPTYDLLDVAGDSMGPTLQVPSPGVDGAYYSGGQCSSYYGQDATTGAYVEYTAGLGINVLLYDAPLPRQDVEPLGPSTVADVK